MDTVSQLYGWQILLIEKMIVLHLVYTMYYIYLLFHTMTIWLFVIVNILWAAGCFLHGYLIVFSCDDTNKSAQAVLLLSQNLAARTKPDSQVLGKIRFIYKVIPLPNAIIDVIASALVMSICLVNSLSKYLLHRHHDTFLLPALRETDILLDTPDANNIRKLIKTLTYLVTLLSFGCDYYSKTIYFTFDQQKYNLVNLFLMFYNLLIVLRVYDLANTIADRFVLLCNKINNLVRISNSESEILVEADATNCLKCYYVLFEAMETVGRVYGWQILIMEKMITFYVVYTTYYCYLLLSGLAIIFHPMCVLNNVLWTTVFLIYGVLILFSCDEANKKAQSVLLLSRNLIRRTKPKTQIRRVLQQFSSQMSQLDT
ncbi:uncharacterized protein [Tenebrio molitor]|uniref:uncharacterized protein n=1 Tax=Tenebrio molitor TaxID=7067 RepID=UPI0036247C1F